MARAARIGDRAGNRVEGKARSEKAAVSALAAALLALTWGALSGSMWAAIAAASDPAIPRPAVRAAGARAVEPQLTVSSVTLNRSRVAVSGLNTVPVRIMVTGTYPTAAQGGGEAAKLTAILTRTPKVASPALNGLSVPLKRVGTAQATGTWTGVAHVPATLRGALTVTAVTTDDAHVDTGNMTTPVPVNGPSLHVTGYHLPAIVVAPVPKRPTAATRSYAITGRVYDTATRAPYRSRVSVQLVLDGSCRRGVPCALRTDTLGRFIFRIPNTPIGTPPSRPYVWGHNLWLTSAAKDADGYPSLILVKPVPLR